MPQLMGLKLAFLIVPSHTLVHNTSEFLTRFARVPLHGKDFQTKLLFEKESFAGVELNIAELELSDISLQKTFDFCTFLLGCLFKQKNVIKVLHDTNNLQQLLKTLILSFHLP